MYNLNQLQTFIKVAEMGSFNKVAEEEYMSPSAVMKQIDNLEADLGGIRLFNRSKRGNTLTDIGRIFYNEAKTVIAFCEESKKKIIKEAKSEENTVRIAVTRMALFEPAEQMWQMLHERFPEINLKYVPYTYDAEEAERLWDSFEDWTDVALSIMAKGYEAVGFDALSLCEVPIMCELSNIHRLASRSAITPEELAGEVVYTKSDEWWGGCMKPLNDYLRRNADDVELIERNAFDYEMRNECAKGNGIILSIAEKADSHPFVKTIPLQYESLFSFSIVFLKEHGKNVDAFLDAVKTILMKTE